MTLRDDLLQTADTYCAAVNRSRARIGTIIWNDGARFDAIAKGADTTTRNFEKAMQWFSDNWPDDTPWPEGVERPAKQAAAERVAS